MGGPARTRGDRPSGARPRTGRPGLAAAAGSLALLLAACAHMEPPPGGPEDRVRPVVVATYPAPGATRVGRAFHAQLKFSKWLNPALARNQVVLSPPSPRLLRVRVEGDLLDVSCPHPLDSNTTYTLTVLGTATDVHDQALGGDFRLTFSTGPGVDSAGLAGRLWNLDGGSAAGALAGLYPVGPARYHASYLTAGRRGAVRPDSAPDPARERPMYLAQADSAGAFRFTGLRPGMYSLLAFQDKNQDLLPGPGAEAVAIGPARVQAPSAAMAGLALAPTDTVPLKVEGAAFTVESVRGGRVEGTLRVKFNKEPHPREVRDASRYRILAGGGRDTLAVPEAGLDPATGEVELRAPPLRPDSAYALQAVGLHDRYGNAMDTGRASATFRPGRVADSLPVRLSFYRGRDFLGKPIPLGDLPLRPDRALIVRASRGSGDSARKALERDLAVKLDSLIVPTSIAATGLHEFTLRLPPVESRGQRLAFSLRRPVRPARDSARGDSARRDTARTAHAADSVRWENQATATLARAADFARLRLKGNPALAGWTMVLRTKTGETVDLRPLPADSLTIDSLPPGAYRLDAFRDRDRDGIWDPGGWRGWRPQESWFHGSDSLALKAGEATDAPDALAWPPKDATMVGNPAGGSAPPPAPASAPPRTDRP